MASRLIEQRRCDRCSHAAIGAELDGWLALQPRRRNMHGPVAITPNGFAALYDLCPLCAERFLMWLRGEADPIGWKVVAEERARLAEPLAWPEAAMAHGPNFSGDTPR